MLSDTGLHQSRVGRIVGNNAQPQEELERRRHSRVTCAEQSICGETPVPGARPLP